MFDEYFLILKYILFSFFIGILLYLISLLIILRFPNINKNSVYECGFNSFADTRLKFEIKFYLVAILFIIFDLELMFLFPWVVIFFKLNFLGFYSMIIFMIIFILGFLYEWQKQVLYWK